MSAGGGSFPIAFLLQVQGDQEVKSKIQSLGGAFQNFGTQAENVNTQAAKIQPNFSQAALGISAAAAAGASLYFQFDNLEKAALRVDTAEKNLTNARAASIGATETLVALTEKGVTSGNQYEQAVLRQKAAQEQLAIAEQKVSIMQGDLGQAQTQFALTIVPTAIGAASSLTMAVKGLGFGMVATGAQSQVASVGVQKVGVASRIAQLMMGPFGIAMIAISTVFTLVATNAFGIRDALDSFAKKVEEIFPILKPVFDFFRTIASTLFPDAKEETKDLSNTVGSEFTSIANNVGTSADSQKASLAMLSSQFADTNQSASAEMASLASNVSAQSNSIVDSANRARAAMASIGASGSSGLTFNNPNPAANTVTAPNPLGGTTTSSPQLMFGSTPVSSLQANGIPKVDIKIDLDGKEIAARLSRYKLGDMWTGRT